MIAILSAIGVDARSHSVPSAIDRSCQLSPEPIDGFSGVYRQLLHSYRDILSIHVLGTVIQCYTIPTGTSSVMLQCISGSPEDQT